jgi:Na+-transporting methylmalonyl-CoA/oxaloacetate decarboxylase gamma subunit
MQLFSSVERAVHAFAAQESVLFTTVGMAACSCCSFAILLLLLARAVRLIGRCCRRRVPALKLQPKVS